MFTMGDVALCSERNEDLLYKLFGKNAELLIDMRGAGNRLPLKQLKPIVQLQQPQLRSGFALPL